ncbi:MAG: restriction endonuclease subunit S [Gammaproteobacteria bacterium]|nr:restriction endonuclease subunit S [Gammaproteobacteria bacterium]
MSECSQAIKQDAVRDAAPAYRVNAPEVAQNEVPPGYKRTEVGVIPEDWSVKALAHFVSALQAGVSVNSIASDQPINDTPSVLKTSCIQAGTFFPNQAKPISAKDHDRAKLSPKAETILISRMNTPDLVGESGFVEKDYEHLFLPDRIWMTIFKQAVRFSPRWLAYILSSPVYRKHLKEFATGTSGSMKNIAKGSLLNLKVPCPPDNEQSAIATALSDADALIESLDRLIAKKRAIKQAAMQQLLTGQTRLPGFTGEWETKQLGEVGRFRGGSGFPTMLQGETSGRYPFFKVSDMNNEGNETFMEVASNYISEVTRKQLGAIAFPAKSIVFAKVGAAVFLERKKILSKPGCLDNNMAAFVIEDAAADFRFIHYVLLSTKLGSLVSTTALPSLNGKVLAGIECRLPSLNEQQAIATVLSEMDTEIEALKHRRDKARQIKQGMMQQLLTGLVRLVTPEAAA